MVTIDKEYQGLIERDGYYEYPNSLIIEDSVEIKVNLKVGDSLEVGGWLKVGGSLKVGGLLKVGGWLEVGGLITLFEVASTRCILIHSYYSLHALDTHLKIGCQLHTYEEWNRFSDRELLEMSNKESVKWFRENQRWLMSFKKEVQDESGK